MQLTKKSIIGVGCALASGIFLAACNSTSSASHHAPTSAISASSLPSLLLHQSQLINKATRWNPALAKLVYAGSTRNYSDLAGVLDVKIKNNYPPPGYKDLYSHLISQSLPARGSSFPQMLLVDASVNTSTTNTTAQEGHAQIFLEERTSANSPWRIVEEPQTFVSLLPHLQSILSTSVNAKSLVMTPAEAVAATTQSFNAWENIADQTKSPQYFPQILNYATSNLTGYEFSSLKEWTETGMFGNKFSSHWNWSANQSAVGTPITIAVDGGALVFYNAQLSTTLSAHAGSTEYLTVTPYGAKTKIHAITQQANMQYAVFVPSKKPEGSGTQPSIKVVGVTSFPSQMVGTTIYGETLPAL